MPSEPSLVDPALKAELSALYLDEGRHYHGLAHIEAMLGLAAAHRDLLSDAEAVDAAIWFHDAIYDSRASDNEERSAALARRKLAGKVEPARLARIAAMIEATKSHQEPAFDDPAHAADAALFLDMDLAILGASPDMFDWYEEAVRREYGWVDEPAWRTGRAAVLRKFLARPRIYQSQAMAKFEEAARRNVARSLAALEA